MTVAELKSELRNLKKERRYIARFWELNCQGLNNFLHNNKNTNAEDLKEWKHVNSVINRNNWSVMNHFYRDFDKEINALEEEINKLERGKILWQLD